MRKPVHVSGLLISPWEPANSLFVGDKSVTPTDKRLHAGYVQKWKHVKNIPFDTTARSKQHVRGVEWRLTDTIYSPVTNKQPRLTEQCPLKHKLHTWSKLLVLIVTTGS